MPNEGLQNRPAYFIPFKTFAHLIVKVLQLWEMVGLWHRETHDFLIYFKYLGNETVLLNGLATKLILGASRSLKVHKIST